MATTRSLYIIVVYNTLHNYAHVDSSVVAGPALRMAAPRLRPQAWCAVFGVGGAVGIAAAIGEGGSAPKGGRHSTIFVTPQ